MPSPSIGGATICVAAVTPGNLAHASHECVTLG